MREILYKAQRKDTREWVEGFPYYGDYSGAFILQNKPVKRRNARTGTITLGDEVVPIEVDGNTYCQYTGKKDKQGNKIFDRDIVIHKYMVGRGKEKSEIIIVQWVDYQYPIVDYDTGLE